MRVAWKDEELGGSSLGVGQGRVGFAEHNVGGWMPMEKEGKEEKEISERGRNGRSQLGNSQDL